MNVIVKLHDGREAIPVRAIPLLSNWVTMGSDAIAQALAEDEHFYSFHGLKAYYAEGNLLRDIKPRMWKHEICRRLKALHESIEVTEATHESGLQEWRIGSLKVLPAGAFVWRDEFEPLYYASYRPERMPILLEDTGVMEKGEHEQRIELNFEPFVAELAIRELVMEGFEHLQPAPSAAPSSEVEHAEVETLIERIAAVMQGIDYWETRDDSKASDAEIKERKLLALRAELAPLLAKKRIMRGDYTDAYPAPRQAVAKPHTTSSDASSFDEVRGGALTEYLPTHATVAQACHWLRATNGDSWTLARLLEHGLRPWVWLDYHPGWPSIFGNRLEGYLAQMVFAGDVQRLQVDGSEALITMTHTHDGKIIKIDPGLRAPISELRFIREEVQGLGKGPSLQRSSLVSGTESVVDNEALTGQIFSTLPALSSWNLIKPKRMQGYGRALYAFLQAAQIANKPYPRARDVLDEWKQNKPLEILEITNNDELKYYDGSGNVKVATQSAIREAIKRMTTQKK